MAADAGRREDSARGLPACPSCRAPMQVLHLDPATGGAVEVELCAPCRVVWFDERESLRLSGLGWVQLLLQMQHDHPAEHAWAGDKAGCITCGQPLAARSNQTKYGRFVVQSCAQGHGSLRSEATLLAERGLVREPSLGERAALSGERAQWSCLNCGAPFEGERACRFCTTPLLMVDVPRLATSLRPQAGERELPRSGLLRTWPCHACG